MSNARANRVWSFPRSTVSDGVGTGAPPRPWSFLAACFSVGCLRPPPCSLEGKVSILSLYTLSFPGAHQEVKAILWNDIIDCLMVVVDFDVAQRQGGLLWGAFFNLCLSARPDIVSGQLLAEGSNTSPAISPSPAVFAFVFYHVLESFYYDSTAVYIFSLLPFV